jgi:hypothetical protein
MKKLTLGERTHGGLILGSGISTDPESSSTAGEKFMSFYLSNSATSDDSRGMYLRLYVAGAGGGGESLRAFTSVDDVAAATVHGAHISLGYETSGTATGTASALRVTHHIPSTARSANNVNYNGIQVEFYSDAATSDPNASQLSVFRIGNAGNATGAADVDTDAYLFYLDGWTSGSGKMYYGSTLRVYAGGAKYLVMSSAEDSLTMDGRVIISSWGSTYTASALTVGAYGTPIADTALTDNILASINGSTATEKTADDTSCMALFVGMRNTALTDQPHTKLQGILISTLVYANCFDAYGVQGHVAVKADATAVAGGTNAGNICGGSFKATVDTAMTATGTVSGALITLDGAGTVTGTHSGLWIDATVSCDNGILISSTGTMTTGISFGGTITSLFEIPAATTGGANGGGADVYVDVTIGGVAARLTAKYIS